MPRAVTQQYQFFQLLIQPRVSLKKLLQDLKDSELMIPDLIIRAFSRAFWSHFSFCRNIQYL